MKTGLRRAISQAISRAIEDYRKATGEDPPVGAVEDAVSWGSIDVLAAMSTDGTVKEIAIPKARSRRGAGSRR